MELDALFVSISSLYLVHVHQYFVVVLLFWCIFVSFPVSFSGVVTVVCYVLIVRNPSHYLLGGIILIRVRISCVGISCIDRHGDGQRYVKQGGQL